MSAAPTAGIDSTLAALADPMRRRIVERLRDGPARSSDLARALAMSPPAMSKHLRVLRHGRVVEETGIEADARVRLYRLRQEPFHELETWLEEMGTYWRDQLAAFKAHVERNGG